MGNTPEIRIRNKDYKVTALCTQGVPYTITARWTGFSFKDSRGKALKNVKKWEAKNDYR